MNLNITRIAASVSLALSQMGMAAAQDAPTPPPPAPVSDGLSMETIVVTGTTNGTSKMKSSNSVSSMELDTILHNAPTSAAEVLRSVPGLRALHATS